MAICCSPSNFRRPARIYEVHMNRSRANALFTLIPPGLVRENLYTRTAREKVYNASLG